MPSIQKSSPLCNTPLNVSRNWTVAGSPRYPSCLAFSSTVLRQKQQRHKPRCWPSESSQNAWSTESRVQLTSASPFQELHEQLAFDQGQPSIGCATQNRLGGEAPVRIAQNTCTDRVAGFRVCVSRQCRNWSAHARPHRKEHWPEARRSVTRQTSNKRIQPTSVSSLRSSPAAADPCRWAYMK